MALLSKIAKTLDLTIATLMSPERIDRRTELAISLEHAQRSELYSNLELPKVRTGPSLPIDALEALVGLHQELLRRSSIAAATPEEARKANSLLRISMRKRNNYYREIEGEAKHSQVFGRELTANSDWDVGAMLIFQSIRSLDDLAPQCRSIHRSINDLAG